MREVKACVEDIEKSRDFRKWRCFLRGLRNEEDGGAFCCAVSPPNPK